MRTPFAIAVACAVLGGCAIIVTPNGDGDYQVRTPFSSDSVEGNGVPARDERTIATVPGLEVNGTITVDVRVGPATSLVVEADSNLLPFIRTELRGDRLVIEKERSFRTNHPVRVTYTVPRLTDVRHNGSGHLTVQDLNGAPLVVAEQGSGTVVLTGRVSNLDAAMNGSGSIDATTLQSGGVLILTGKGYGTTNLLALDRSGRIILDSNVQVQAAKSSDLVVVYRGDKRQSYSCAPECAPRITLGDDLEYFDGAQGQSVRRLGAGAPK